MHFRSIAGVAALALIPLLSSGALSQLAVSANDGNAVLVDGANVVPAGARAGLRGGRRSRRLAAESDG
jgi:hypothetical protein